MCRMYGGYLAEIITASENTFLTGYTQNQGSKSEFCLAVFICHARTSYSLLFISIMSTTIHIRQLYFVL